MWCFRASVPIVWLGGMQDKWAVFIVTWLAGIHCMVTGASPGTSCIGELFVMASTWFLLLIMLPMLFWFITSSRRTILLCELASRRACSSILFIRIPSGLFALSSWL